MIGSIAEASIKIGSGQYPLTSLRGKTLYATKKLPLYATYKPGAAVRGYVNPGQYIGIIQGFVANGYKGANGSFFIIGNSTKDANTKFIPYAPSNFSESNLRGQGTKTGSEILAQEDKEGQAWYIKLAKQILPWAVGGYIVSQFIKKQ